MKGVFGAVCVDGAEATPVAGRQRPEEVERFLARFQPAQDAILKAGKPVLVALNRLCHDEAASSVRDEARKGLAQLIVHFRLDAQ